MSHSREVPFSPHRFDALAEREPEERRRDLPAELVQELREIIHSRLTDRQRQIVDLYFYEHLSQQEISVRLGISQQAVSRQLFGVLRDGRRIGGAVRRLRQVCEELGWDPSEWV